MEKAEVGRASEEKSRSEKVRDGESQKKEDAGARKGRKVAIHCLVPMVCGSGGSKNRLAGCGAIWPDGRWKVARRDGAKPISKSKCTKHHMLGPLVEADMSKKCTPSWREAQNTTTCSEHFWMFRCRFASQAQGVVHRIKNEQKDMVFQRFQRWWQVCVWHFKSICKDALPVAGAVQETCSSEMLGGQGADFLREVAFWSIRSSGLLKWSCATSVALRVTWHQFVVAGAIL